MIALAFAAATAAQMTAIDAERAFAADAQEIGQWAAFRKWSTADALMFAPRPVSAHELLKDQEEPAVAVFWWPGRSYVSCDGTLAVNTGPWVRQWGKSVGYFTTVWKRQADGGWKWVYDAGDSLQVPRSEGGDIKPVVASCEGKPPADNGPDQDSSVGGGASPDGSLRWSWTVAADGARSFRASLWNGRAFDEVVADDVAAPGE